MKKTLIYIAALFVFASCEKLVEIETPQGLNNIVVESKLSTLADVWEIHLTKTQAYYNQDTVTAVDNAIVTISDSEGNSEILSYTPGGFYASAGVRQCIPGRTYFLTIEVDGERYEASDYCRFQEPFDTIAAYFLPENNGFIRKGWYVFEKAEESLEEGDHYEWNIIRNDTLLEGFGFLLDEDMNRGTSFFNLSIDKDDPLAGIPQGILPRPFPFRFNPGDSAVVMQHCFNKGYYDFLIEVQNQKNNSGTPFDSPPANPNSNISNGAYGYFVVKNTIVGSTVIPE